MNYLYTLLLCLGLITASASYEVQHTLDAKTFSTAGELSPSTQQQQETWTFSRLQLEPKQRSAFESLVSKNGFYTIKVSDGQGHEVTASVRAACLAAADFSDRLTLHVDERKLPVSLVYSVAGGCPADPSAAASSSLAQQLTSRSWSFDSRAQVHLPRSKLQHNFDS